MLHAAAAGIHYPQSWRNRQESEQLPAATVLWSNCERLTQRLLWHPQRKWNKIPKRLHYTQRQFYKTLTV